MWNIFRSNDNNTNNRSNPRRHGVFANSFKTHKIYSRMDLRSRVVIGQKRNTVKVRITGCLEPGTCD